jgi:mRNA interferase RelE/StbE
MPGIEKIRGGPSAARGIFEYLEGRLQNAIDPRAFGKPVHKPKHGLWRYRVQDYRTICRLEDSTLTLIVVTVGHRSVAYGE